VNISAESRGLKTPRLCDAWPLGAVRLSLGRATTKEDVAVVVSSLAAAWRVTFQTKRLDDQVLPALRRENSNGSSRSIPRISTS
jgi:hypothetical protein